MIDGKRRGEQAGAEVARLFPCALSQEEAAILARCILAIYRARGYAHLDPEEQFITGFVAQYQVVQQA